jgi:hypothetical protein
LQKRIEVRAFKAHLNLTTAVGLQPLYRQTRILSCGAQSRGQIVVLTGTTSVTKTQEATYLSFNAR